MKRADIVFLDEFLFDCLLSFKFVYLKGKMRKSMSLCVFIYFIQNNANLTCNHYFFKYFFSFLHDKYPKLIGEASQLEECPEEFLQASESCLSYSYIYNTCVCNISMQFILLAR